MGGIGEIGCRDSQRCEEVVPTGSQLTYLQKELRGTLDADQEVRAPLTVSQTLRWERGRPRPHRDVQIIARGSAVSRGT